MTDIGSALLQLLIGSPGEWEYAPGCDGLRHPPTGILLSPATPDVVVLLAAGELRTIVLSAEDHAGLYRALLPVIERHKRSVGETDRAVMAKLLKLGGAHE